MNDKLLFHMHIMWYESKMLNETFDSIYNAMQYSSLPIDIILCLNSQTYLELPIEGNTIDMFNEFMNHPIIKLSTIIYKTDADSFYNIGDWRREMYNSIEYKYVIWGESDCLVPIDYFHILSHLNIDFPHVLTLSSRKMWDRSWTSVEHISLQNFNCVDNQTQLYSEYYPYRYFDYINQNQLNDFNSDDTIKLFQIIPLKFDGAMIALSSKLPTPFISDTQHFCNEDFCAQLFFQHKNIPQYNIINRLKGHNYHHPLKRTNTSNTRNDQLYHKYKTESIQAANNFLKSIYENSIQNKQ